jgi:2-dehydro-3-deoxygluconokinase
MTAFDVITLGEPLLRLTPAHLRRIEQALSWEMHVVGSELNTSVGLARLGLRVAYLTRLTDNLPGRLIRSTLDTHGVNTEHIVWTPEDRVGLFYLEQGAAPRAAQVVYDRAGSAVSKMQPSDLPAALFAPGNARLLHTTGISLAVSPALAETTIHAARLAKEASWVLSFDINYRGKLWSYPQAAAGCQPLLEMADVIFTPLRDAVPLWGLPDANPERALEVLHSRYPHALCVLTLGADGAAAVDGDGHTWSQPVFKAQVVDRIGGGDAFSAGFLYAMLSQSDGNMGAASALRWGCAAAALKYTIIGDLPLFSRAEVAALVAQTGGGDVVR